MPDLEALLEAERRGILPQDKVDLLVEARRRGLVPTPLDKQAVRSEEPMPEGFFPTLGHEVSKGLEQLGTGLSGKGAESMITGRGLKVPATNVIEGGLRTVSAPFTAAGRKVGQVTQDVARAILPKILPYEEGAKESAAYLGAAADAAAQLGIPYLTGAVSRAVEPVLSNLIPTRAERLARVASEAENAKAAANQDLAKNIQNSLDLAKAGGAEASTPVDVAKAAETEAANRLNAVTEAANKETLAGAKEFTTRKAAQAEKYGPSAVRTLQETIAPGAPTAQEAGKSFVQDIYPAQQKASAARFDRRYGDLIKQGETIQVNPTETAKSIDSILGEGGTAKEALNLPAERAGARMRETLGEPAPVLPTGENQPVTLADLKSTLGKSNPLRDDDRVFRRMFERLHPSQPGVPQSMTVDLMKEALGPDLQVQNAGDMVKGIIRLRAAKRAAYAAGRDNIGRQFGVIEDGMLSDIKNASKDYGSRFDRISRDFKTQHVPLYSAGAVPRELVDRIGQATPGVEKDFQEAVKQVIRPASNPHRVEAIDSVFQVMKNPADQQALTGAWLRGKIDDIAAKGQDVATELPKFWDQYLDPRSNNHVLRTAFGNKFDKVNDFMQGLKQHATDDFESVANDAVDNILKARKGAIASAQKASTEAQAGTEAATKTAAQTIQDLQKRTGVEIGQMGKARDALLGKIEKQSEQAVSEIVGKPISAEGIRRYVIHRGTFAIVAEAAWRPEWALQTVAGAGLVYMGAPLVAKFLNTVRGAQLLSRAVRAIPGTAEAISNAAQIQNFAKALKVTEEGLSQPSETIPSTAAKEALRRPERLRLRRMWVRKYGIPSETTHSTTVKEALMRKYGIP